MRRRDDLDDSDGPNDPGDPAFPRAAAAAETSLAGLDARVTRCAACPRLVAWREEKAHDDLPAYRGQRYWARPVPGFGPADAPLLIVGLAPAAHGANRTGRMFTGDRSGDVLFAALHALGLASRPDPVAADDGMTLRGVRMSSPVRCAPPANRPTPAERDTCRPWLARELRLLAPTLRTVVVLGAFGWQALMPALAEAGWALPRPRPAFGHGTRVTLGQRDGQARLDLFGCYHVSQRNVFTGRLTPLMLREVLEAAAEAAGILP
ncbi:uracil-DNA glycosylase [Streptomyces sp. NRRL F-5126]|uniref:uracil-DNA glycosylase n=1 Tax=Streptomyces sp. NRRL F-5126 TaxID=1463857 RepID=UPI0004C4C250|nr:uracil-DNA glycosylase [Streptomyces sp. NRRL F-5126]